MNSRGYLWPKVVNKILNFDKISEFGFDFLKQMSNFMFNINTNHAQKYAGTIGQVTHGRERVIP